MRDMKEADINPYALICHTSIRDKGFPIFMCNFQSLFPGLLLSLFQPSEMALLCAPQVLPFLSVLGTFHVLAQPLIYHKPHLILKPLQFSEPAGRWLPPAPGLCLSLSLQHSLPLAVLSEDSSDTATV